MAGAMMYMFHPCMPRKSNPGQLVVGAMMYMFTHACRGRANPGQLVAGAMVYLCNVMRWTVIPVTTCLLYNGPLSLWVGWIKPDLFHLEQRNAKT